VALHFAAFWGYLDVVKALVEAGADVTARNNVRWGKTEGCAAGELCLCWSPSNHTTSAVPTRHDVQKGETAEDDARGKGRADIVAFLQQQAAVVPS
jgi:ankyrin repeat protein